MHEFKVGMRVERTEDGSGEEFRRGLTGEIIEQMESIRGSSIKLDDGTTTFWYHKFMKPIENMETITVADINGKHFTISGTPVAKEPENLAEWYSAKCGKKMMVYPSAKNKLTEIVRQCIEAHGGRMFTIASKERGDIVVGLNPSKEWVVFCEWSWRGLNVAVFPDSGKAQAETCLKLIAPYLDTITDFKR